MYYNFLFRILQEPNFLFPYFVYSSENQLLVILGLTSSAIDNPGINLDVQT